MIIAYGCWPSSRLTSTMCRLLEELSRINIYFPAGSTAPGTCTGSLNVTSVFLVVIVRDERRSEQSRQADRHREPEEPSYVDQKPPAS